MIFYCIEFECESFWLQAWLLSILPELLMCMFYFSFMHCIDVVFKSSYADCFKPMLFYFWNGYMQVAHMNIWTFYWNCHLTAPSFLPSLWNHYIHAFLISEIISTCVTPNHAVLLVKYFTNVGILLLSIFILIFLILLVSVPPFFFTWYFVTLNHDWHGLDFVWFTTLFHERVHDLFCHFNWHSTCSIIKICIQVTVFQFPALYTRILSM